MFRSSNSQPTVLLSSDCLNSLSVLGLSLTIHILTASVLLALDKAACPVDTVRWTIQENWVLSQVCDGEIANLNRALGISPELAPNSPEWANSDRILRAEFLEFILLNENFKTYVTRSGIRIVGAWVVDALDLDNAIIAHEFWIDRSKFEKEVSLRRTHIHRLVSFEGTHFRATVDFDAAVLDSELTLKEATLTVLDLRSTRITGQVRMDATNISEQVILDDAVLSRDFYIRNSRFPKLTASKVSIGGDLNLALARVSDSILLDRSRIGSTLNVDGASIIGDISIPMAAVGGRIQIVHANIGGEVNADSTLVGDDVRVQDSVIETLRLVGAKVNDQIAIVKSRISKSLELDSVETGGSIMLSRTRFDREIGMVSADVGANLHLSGGTFRGIDMSGTTIHGELIVGIREMEPCWWVGSRVLLRNVRVKALGDTPSTWGRNIDYAGLPLSIDECMSTIPRLDFDAFLYGDWGGMMAEGESPLALRDAQWFVALLESHRPFSPQPYQQLAQVMRSAGYDRMASDIQFAARERERIEDTDGALVDAVWQYLLMIMVGYGIRPYYALYWAVGAVFVGALIYRGSEEGAGRSTFASFNYSLDHFLPFVELRKSNYEKDLSGWRAYYFDAHKLLGYVLVSLLVAGWTGLVD